MTTWNSVKDYIRANYRIQREADDALVMVFETGNLRSQLVFISRTIPGDGADDWVEVSSPIGTFDELDVAAVVKGSENMVCGAVSAAGDRVVLRHSAPLVNLDINELEQPLGMVVHTADRLEKQFNAGDRY